MLYLNKSNKLILIAAAVICLLLFLHYVGPLRPLENATVYLTKPLLGLTYGASDRLVGWFAEWRSRASLIVENRQLQSTLLDYEKERSLYLTEQEENDFLRKQMNFSKQNNFQTLTAAVIGRTADSSQNTLIIGLGAKSGIAVGAPALSADGALVGKVSQVNQNDALVLIASDDLFKVAVKVQNQTRTMGLIEGEYGIGMKMTMIPQSEVVKEGDLIVTSGMDLGIPSGLLVGSVESVRQSPEELFQEAVIKPSADLNSITMVSVLKKP
ncbi:MAG: rod shape-determining protein MreC [Parcubacteria group bacterium]